MRAGADIDRTRDRRALARGRRADIRRSATTGASREDGGDGAGGWDGWDGWAEVRHDALAALLGIEAAAQSLSRHRHLLSAAQVDELASGLVAEVDRLRALLAARGPGRSSRPPGGRRPAELREAVMPVVVCARACGQRVLVDVPADVHVCCDREVVARALLTLLANARRHAPGSPVGVRASVEREHVELRVEDRGPGVPVALQETLFERGARSGATGGSGLGLHTARALVSGQGGAIGHAPRTGGGATFVVQLPRAAPDAAGSTGQRAGAGGPARGMVAGGAPAGGMPSGGAPAAGVPTGEVPAVP